MLAVLPASAAHAADDEPQVAASQDCADEYRTETGVCAPPVETPPLTGLQMAQSVAKAKDWLNGEIAMSHGKAPVNKSHSPFAARRRGPIDDGVYVYRIPEVVNMTIWKEGQGNGKKSYTCGPAATRNMVNAMNKRATGSYNDLGENQWAIWEGTTTAGTARANIANALNAHASQYGSWTAPRPATKEALLSTIATNTYYYKQSVILNVDTAFFNFWNGKNLGHFNFAYGYDTTNSAAKFVSVGEEWDPIFIYGSSSYGNPYGKHANVPLSDAFNAVNYSSIHGIVA